MEKPDTWKKMSAVSQASACDGNMAVKLQRSYHRNDEDETEVDKEDNAKGSGDRRTFRAMFYCSCFCRN